MPRAVGRYELVRAIGRGGMAEVFLARRRGAAGIRKRLVVKRMRQDLASDPRFAELFLREARVATQLSHKNIVTVFDVGRDQEGLFLAMEYVEGPDLAAAIQGGRERGLRFDPLIAAHVASEVAAGLDYAHRVRDERGAPLGLVHRDITPRNILLSLDGEVKVTDFGVAVLHGDAADERRGTVPYMSPEQARSEDVDPRADLFSLGLVLFELLADRRAYDGQEKEAVLALARAGAVPPLDPDVPAELARVVARATAPGRDDRFACARDMQRELAGWAVSERGRRGQADPLEHALASFLAAAVPAWGESDGQESDGRSVGVAGTATLRSVAETVGEAAAPDAKIESTEPTRRSRRPALLIAAGTLAVVAAAVVLATTRGGGDPRRLAAAEAGARAAGGGDPIGAPSPATGPVDPASGSASDPHRASDPDPAFDPDPVSGPGPDPVSDPATGTDPDPDPDSVSDPATGTVSDPDPHPDPDPDPATGTVPDPHPASDSATGSVSVSGPDPVRVADRDPPPDPATPATTRRTPPTRSGQDSRDRPARASRAPPPARSRARTGTLELNAVPWAYVSIDGGPEEETPIRGRVLGAGTHTVRIRNPVLERTREIAVEISPGETTRYVVDLHQ